MISLVGDICIIGFPLLVGIIVGMIATSIAVLLDWHEHPKRSHGVWGTADHRTYICSKCNHIISKEPTKFCECCGAEMSKYERVLDISKYINQTFTQKGD